MDWTSLIIEFLAFLFGGGLVTIVTLRQIRNRENIKNESLAIKPLRETNEQLRGEIQRMEARYTSLEEKYEAMVARMEAKQSDTTKKYEDKCEECATAKNMMCVHLGCSLRDPMLGQGADWYEAHKDNLSLGVDYTSVNVLMKNLGAKRKKEQSDEAKD